MDLRMGIAVSGSGEDCPSFLPRRTVRVKVKAGTNLRDAGNEAVEIMVCDLSTAGFMAESLQPILIGSYVSIDLPGIGIVHAQVRWQLGGRMGGKFLEPINLVQCSWVTPDA